MYVSITIGNGILTELDVDRKMETAIDAKFVKFDSSNN